MKITFAGMLIFISIGIQAQQGGGGVPSGATPVPGTGGHYTGPISAPSVNGSLNANLFAGSDIGAKVNAAYAQLAANNQFGVVTIDPTVAPGNQTTTITIPQGDILDCQGTTLAWPASSGVQIVYGGPSTVAGLSGAIRNCTLVGGGGTSIGIYAGGDPAGVISPSDYYGNGLGIDQVIVKGFGAGYTHGNNTWANVIRNSTLIENTNNIVSAPSDAIDQGEATKIIGTVIANAANCGFSLNNADDVYYMIGGNLDYNAAGGVCGTGASISLRDVWQEQYFGPLVDVTTTASTDNVQVSGGHAVLTAQAATITNVAIAGNVLTLILSSAPSGYTAGHELYLSGLTTATFLNGETVTILSSSGSTITANFTHADYAATSDTGNTSPTAPDIWHVEGAGSFAKVEGVYELLPSPISGAPQVATTAIGVGSTTTNTACIFNLEGAVSGITGTLFRACASSGPLWSMVDGSTEVTLSAAEGYLQTAQQGYDLGWNGHLGGVNGEMDIINVHGAGTGGFVFCDGTYNFTPTNCQGMLSTTGNFTITGAVKSATYTVSTLPAASSLTAGSQLVVTDATTFTPGACTGGGSDYMIAVTNGTSWSCH